MSVRTRHPLAAAVLVSALVALSSWLTGCSHRTYQESPPATDQSIAGNVLGVRPWDGLSNGGATLGGRQFYPLAVGNRWEYALHLRVTMVTSDGPQPPQVTDTFFSDVITGTVLIGTRTYFLQQEYNPLAAAPPRILPNSGIPLREDRSGLYEREVVTVLNPAAALTEAMRADVARLVARPAERAAFERAYARLAAQLASARRGAATFTLPRSGGPDPGELALLRYPLFTGARWSVRGSPTFGREALARERVLVPAGAFMAWHLRGTSELFGPEDRVAYWYASVGLVRMSFHFESLATDEAGNVIGRVIGDQDQVLTGLTLVDPNAPRTFAQAPVEGGEPR